MGANTNAMKPVVRVLPWLYRIKIIAISIAKLHYNQSLTNVVRSESSCEEELDLKLTSHI